MQKEAVELTVELCVLPAMRPEGEHVQGLADRGYEDDLTERVTRRPRAAVSDVTAAAPPAGVRLRLGHVNRCLLQLRSSCSLGPPAGESREAAGG